jgi:hypothetical protein
LPYPAPGTADDGVIRHTDRNTSAVTAPLRASASPQNDLLGRFGSSPLATKR